LIKNLFTKHDHRQVTGITKEQAMQAASWYWRYRQFGITFTSPYSLRGGQYYSKLGLRQWVDVYAVDEGPNVGVDITFYAELTDEGAIVGVVGAVLLLPVTAVVGAVSYVEYENDATREMNEFWAYLFNFPKNPQPPSGPEPPHSWTQAPPAPVTTPAPAPSNRCRNCGAVLDSDSKFCKLCGTKV